MPANALRPAGLLPPAWVKPITSAHVLEGYNKISEPRAPRAASGGHELSAKVNYVIALSGKERRVAVAPEPLKQVHIHTH